MAELKKFWKGELRIDIKRTDIFEKVFYAALGVTMVVVVVNLWRVGGE